MKYAQAIHSAESVPQQLEALYREARQAHLADEFTQDLLARYREAPDNLLLEAWSYRLVEPAAGQEGRRIQWQPALILSLAVALTLWLLSSDLSQSSTFAGGLPRLAYWAGPVIGVGMLGFLTIVRRQGYYLAGGLALLLVAAGVYVMMMASGRQPYLQLMALHLPILVLAAVGIYVAGLSSAAQVRFAFLIKAIEVVVTAGVYAIAVVVFAGITLGMFEALGITIPESVMRLLIIGGGGLVPVFALATVYDPLVGPQAQPFDQGLSKMIVPLPRLLLPLCLIVLGIYLVFIPFNFMAPFQDRDVLIIYNVMLFAVMGLLVGATPVFASEPSERYQKLLRSGILALAILVVLVSLYAMSATIYRTIQGGWTLNRLTIIGWNTINIGLLALLVYRQLRANGQKWVAELHEVFSAGSVAYVAWTIFLLLFTPWLF